MSLMLETAVADATASNETCRCGETRAECRCDPRPEDCGPHCSCSGPQAPDIHALMAERRKLDARRKAVVDEVEGRVKEIDAILWPLFSDERPRLEDDGYTLTRVVPEPKLVVAWDVERAIAERPALVHVMQQYRTEQVKTGKPYLRASVAKGASRS